MKLKNITPCGKMVLLEIKEQKKKEDFELKGKLFIPTSDNATNVATTQQGEKKKVIVYVKAIGPEVEADKINFKIGDEVMYNQYDLITLGDDEGALYGLTKAESILAVIEAER